MEISKIGEKEAVAYLVTIVIAKVFLTYPAVLVGYVANAAWAVVALSGLMTLFFMYFVVKLVVFSWKIFSKICEKLGPYLGSGFCAVPWLVDRVFANARFSESMLIVALPKRRHIVMLPFVEPVVAVYLYQGIARLLISFPYTGLPFCYNFIVF